jgi:hypothetical protein
MKAKKTLYWISTILLILSLLSGAGLYIFDYQHAYNEFNSLSFPTYLIYPLAIAKTAGSIGILQKQSLVLREWAYAGITFNLLLAFGAHYMANDGEAFGPILVLVFLLISYFLKPKNC